MDNLSLHPVKNIINKVLKNDATKWFDAAAVPQFDATPLRVVPTGGTSTSAVTLTTNGTATLTNNVAFNKQHAKAIVDTMKERNIPSYEGDDYFALAWPTTYRTLKNDLESIRQYTDKGFTMIMNGEIGRYENVRYVESYVVPFISDFKTRTVLIAHSWDVQGGSNPAEIAYNATLVLLTDHRREPGHGTGHGGLPGNPHRQRFFRLSYRTGKGPGGL